MVPNSHFSPVHSFSKQPLVLTTKAKETLNSFLYKDDDKQWFEADIYVGLAHEKHLGSFVVRVSDILLNNHFDPASTYPTNEKYFISSSPLLPLPPSFPSFPIISSLILVRIWGREQGVCLAHYHRIPQLSAYG
jgi:hypothetical protein